MRPSFLVSDLAQLFLKNHFELRDTAARLLQNSPYQLALTLGNDGAASTMSVDMRDGQMHLMFREGDRAYELWMPLQSAERAVLKVKLTEGKFTKTYDVKPEDFVDAKLSDGFKGLHEKVAQYLKALVPSNFFAKRDAAAASAAPAAAAPSAEAPTQSSGEVSTADTPAGDATGQAAANVATPPVDEYSTYVVSRANERDLRFRGKLVAGVESWPRNGRQHHYKVFVTPSGKYVGIKLGTSMWLGEQDRVQVQVADKVEDLVAFFGYDSLAKALYTRLSLAHEEVLE